MSLFCISDYSDKVKEFREICNSGLHLSNSINVNNCDYDEEIKKSVLFQADSDTEREEEVREEVPVPVLGLGEYGHLLERVEPVHVEGVECGQAEGVLDDNIGRSRSRSSIGDDRPCRDAIVWCEYRLYGKEDRVLWAPSKRNTIVMEQASQECVLYGVMMGMCFTPVGRTSVLVLPPDMLYGELGIPPLVPPDSWGILLMRVHYYIDTSSITQYARLDESSKREFAIVKPLIEKTVTVGKKFFHKECYREAVQAYDLCLEMLAECEEREKEVSLLSTLYLNKALCYEKLGKSGKFLEFLDKALQLEVAENRCKILFLKGRHLFRNTPHLQDGYRLLLDALALQPCNQAIAKELLCADEKVSENKEVLTEIAMKAISVGAEEHKKKSATRRLSEESQDKCYEALEDIVHKSASVKVVTLPGKLYSLPDFRDLEHLVSVWNQRNSQRNLQVLHKHFQLKIKSI